MVNEVTFSLSYDQLTQITEEEIKKRVIRYDRKESFQELSRASDILRFWFVLAMRGYPGILDMEFVEADRLRLENLIRHRREGIV